MEGMMGAQGRQMKQKDKKNDNIQEKKESGR